jgi:hypothetical protein
MFYKKFIEIMEKNGYKYTLWDSCDTCNVDKSDGTEYYENCVDCNASDSTLEFNNGIHELNFDGVFGENFSRARFFHYGICGADEIPIPFSIDDIVFIAFLEKNLIGFKLKNGNKMEIKNGYFFRVKKD